MYRKPYSKVIVSYSVERFFLFLDIIFAFASDKTNRPDSRHVFSSSQSDYSSRSWIGASILLRVGYLGISRKTILRSKTVCLCF